jgi:hypothetical protein
MALPIGVLQPNGAFAYSCTGVDHCYGVNSWSGGTTGVSAWITANRLTCSGCGLNDFITNELWLATGSQQYWVEAGITTYNKATDTNPANTPRTSYFWADWRPGSQWYEHEMDQIPGADLGQYTYFEILKVSGANQFNVTVSGYSGYHAYGYSTDNTMGLPGIIQVGQELAGTAGASAPTAHYIYNQWFDSSSIPHYQGANGALNPSVYNSGATGPIVRSWAILPSSPNSYGGDLWTSCGC